MVIERHYDDEGRPAYVLTFKRARDGTVGAVSLIYVNAPDFTRLWDMGVEPMERDPVQLPLL